MSNELKKAELAAHAYDGLGAPMSYRPHVAALTRNAEPVVAQWQVWVEDDFGLAGWVNEEAEMIEHWRSKGRKVRALYASATPPVAPTGAVGTWSRYHFTDDKPIYVKDGAGEWHHIGAGWLAISEAEYAALSAPTVEVPEPENSMETRTNR
jgi:hypothetical protein